MTPGSPMMFRESASDRSRDYNLCIICNIRIKPDSSNWSAMVYEPHNDAIIMLTSGDCSLYYLHGESFDHKSIIEYNWQELIPINMTIDHEFTITFTNKPILKPTNAIDEINRAINKYTDHIGTWMFNFNMGGK